MPTDNKESDIWIRMRSDWLLFILSVIQEHAQEQTVVELECCLCRCHGN